MNIQIESFFVSINTLLTTAGCLLTASLMTVVLLVVQMMRWYRRLQYRSLAESPACDLQPLAGEDVRTAQLDLARAWIEMGRKEEARQILTGIRRKGTPEQRQAAARLMAGSGL